MCKIRKPSQAPVKLICQFKTGNNDPDYVMALAMSLNQRSSPGAV